MVRLGVRSAAPGRGSGGLGAGAHPRGELPGRFAPGGRGAGLDDGAGAELTLVAQGLRDGRQPRGRGSRTVVPAGDRQLRRDVEVKALGGLQDAEGELVAHRRDGIDTRAVLLQQAQRSGLGLGAVVPGQHHDRDSRPVQPEVGGGVRVAPQPVAGDTEGHRVRRDPGQDRRLPGPVEREGQHSRRPGGGERGRTHGPGGGTVVDGDQADPPPGRATVHDGRQAPLAHRIEDRVVVDGGPQDHGVHGRLQDAGSVLGPARDGAQGQAELVLDADGGYAGQELHRLRVVEGVGQVLAEDDAQGPGAPAAQRAGAGMGARVAEPLGGRQHPLPGRRGDPLRPVEGVRDRHRRDAGLPGDVGHRHMSLSRHPAILVV